MSGVDNQLAPKRDIIGAILRAEDLEVHLRAVLELIERAGGYMAPEDQATLRLAKDAVEGRE